MPSGIPAVAGESPRRFDLRVSAQEGTTFSTNCQWNTLATSPADQPPGQRSTQGKQVPEIQGVLRINRIFAPMEEWYHYLLLVVVGFAVGFINTVAGGASLISLPVLIFLGLPPSVANGTNRVAIVLQTATATAGFRSKGVNTFPFNLYLGIAALIGSIIGAYIAVDIRGETFNRILAIIMVAVVLLIVFKPKVDMAGLQERITGKYLWAGCFAFFFIGIYGGFINAGIGFIIILFLHIFNRMNLVRVNATKVAVVFIYTLAALLVFVLNDKVIWEVGLVLAAGNMLGAWVSSRFSVKQGDGYIRGFLIAMVLVMAVKLWFFT